MIIFEIRCYNTFKVSSIEVLAIFGACSDFYHCKGTPHILIMNKEKTIRYLKVICLYDFVIIVLCIYQYTFLRDYMHNEMIEDLSCVYWLLQSSGCVGFNSVVT